ncbi:hypothetical protein [Rhizobium rhizogenes]|uniref:hypothetical protein n=1 Tax=Rhizobium rhizogenes TaxID=359 RepID=UPI0015743C47|nr:hypothetical protein [Rhizobium rhizogenes]NTF80538.1 hypothetical protein [Rhizobium rhizogenes]
MQLFDFITQEEIDDLPEDGNTAFLQFVKIARGRLDRRTDQLDDNDEREWRIIRDARYGFMNVVVAAGRRYSVEPFASMEMPSFQGFDDLAHRQFILDVDHYMTQLLLGDGLRTRRDSVALSEGAKSKIRTHLHHLRETVAKSDLAEDKRQKLLDKLVEFDRELDKRRLSLLAVARVTLEVLAVPGAMAGSYEITQKLLGHVVHTVAQEKAAEDEQRKAQLQPPPVILPARPLQKTDRHVDDDDIPF